MKNNSMRLLGFILVAMMLASLFTLSAFAEDTTNVAKIGDTEYPTLQAAMKACVAGDNTITLLNDSAEVFTFKQTAGVNITIDGDGHTFSGKITLDAGGGNLTFTDVTLAPANSRTIQLNASTAPNITFDGCTMVGNGAGTIVHGEASATSNAIVVKNCTASELQYIVSFRQTGSKSVWVENVTATKMTYLVRTQKCPSVTIKDVTADCVILNDIKNDGAGGKLILENVNVNIRKYYGSYYYPVTGSGAGKSWTVEIIGDFTYTRNGVDIKYWDEYWNENNAWFSGNAGYHLYYLPDANSEEREEIDNSADIWTGNGPTYVCRNDYHLYASLSAAADDAKAGDTITALDNITAATVEIDEATTLDLQGYTLTLTEGLVVYNGGCVTGELYNASNNEGAKIIGSVAVTGTYADDEASYMLVPMNGAYVFTRAAILDTPSEANPERGVTYDEATDTYNAQFKVKWDAFMMDAEDGVLVNGTYAEHGIKIVILVTWDGGKQDYYYSDADVQACSAMNPDGQNFDYTFALKANGRENLTITILAVADCGTIAAN